MAVFTSQPLRTSPTKYIVLPWKGKAPMDLPKTVPWWNETQVVTKELDCIVYSIRYRRYSWSTISNIDNILKLHICEDKDEFIDLVLAHQLGTDLGQLWQ